MRYWVEARDRAGLLAAVLRAFEGPDAFLSLEGNLASYSLWALEHASPEPMGPLARQTTDPVLGFVAAPLTPRNVSVVLRAVSQPPGLDEDSSIVHVQVAVGPRLVFGAYDNFHPDSTFTDGILPEALARMQRQGVIGRFEVALR